MSAPKDITVSQDWAKKLHEVGWEAPCYGHYRKGFGGEWFFHSFSDEPEHLDDGQWIPAPTAEEILRRLPESILMKSDFPNMRNDSRNPTVYQGLRIGFTAPNRGSIKSRLCIRYQSDYEPACAGEVIIEDTLANAAAAMWCYLKENNLLPHS